MFNDYYHPYDDDERQLALSECIPSWKEARVWSELRMMQGPMAEEEFESFAAFVSYGTAVSVNRCRCRTTFGWYIQLWIDWFAYVIEAWSDYPLYKSLTSVQKKRFKYYY